MIFRVAHELPGRLRLRCPVGSFTKEEGRAIGALLETQPGVQSAIASFATGSILIHHDECAREGVLAAVRVMDRSFYGQIGSSLLPDVSGESLGGSLASMLGGVIFRAALPGAVRYAVTFWRAAPLLLKGIKSLLCKGRVNVSVLDASALGVSLIRRDFKTAAVITTLLALGDLLE
ncbi:MAG: heavy metal translocating P-type ATPase, partial [Synergistaceae bacterium]|nr:heavy metal translocating P-type ATPase [Synergistaceae bacterium]